MMKTFATVLCLAVSLSSAAAQSADGPAPDPVAAWNTDRTVPLNAKDLDLSAFQWIARPVIVFANTPNDPLFVEQMSLIAERPEELAQRDVVVIFDTDPDTPSDIRLNLRPRGFMLAVVGKDGQTKARKPRPWDIRELSRSIDKMPMRQQEMRDRRGITP